MKTPHRNPTPTVRTSRRATGTTGGHSSAGPTGLSARVRGSRNARAQALPVIVLTIALLVNGCAASRPIADVALGAGGAVLGSELSDGNPAMIAAGAAGGVLLSEGAHYLARKESAKAYLSGYDKGRSDAVKQQYWLYVRLQKDRGGQAQVRLYPIHLPEQEIDGAIFKPSVKHLRIEE